MKPLITYLILQHNFLFLNSNRYESTVQHNIHKSLIAANSIQWDNKSALQANVFLTDIFAPVVINSGATFCITHIKNEFIKNIGTPKFPQLHTLDHNIPFQGTGIVK